MTEIIEHPLDWGLADLKKLCIELGLGAIRLSLVSSQETGVTVQGQEGQYTITASRTHLFFRGLLLLASSLKEGKDKIEMKEEATYRDLGFMADVSRNAVLTVSSCKKLITYLALMGYNQFQLYMEDTYRLKDQPYFGYFRGAYEKEELQAIETEANHYGMEFVPCIQTLAHLSAFLKWNVTEVQKIRDLDDILLSGDEGTYTLIDQMFEALSHLKTRRVNIGMDEAHLVGLGRYLNQHGFQKRSLIMCRHLERVLDIAEKYGFRCSMWSDMFFQLLTASKDYNGELEIDQEVASYLNRLKKRVTLIYWDYYQTDKEQYTQKFASHKQLSDNIAFAGGAWKWIGFTPDNEFSLQIAPEAHAACQDYGVKEVTVTAWGDNGGETSTFSILPSLQAWAELAYQGNYNRLEQHFKQIIGLSLSDFIKLDLANKTPSHPGSGRHGFNPNRYILYQDILCPLLQKHILADADSVFYEDSYQKLLVLSKQENAFAYLFKTQASLCKLLACKARISQNIRQAYKKDDLQMLGKCVQELETALLDLAAFQEAHSNQWLLENKVFGLDTIDIRLGGLRARIERAIQRINAYLSGQLESIEELEVTLLPYDSLYQEEGLQATTANQWHLLATASTIYTT